MDVCNECKEIEICSCENFCIAPDGGITTGVDYIVTIVDKFDKKYTQEITGNAYGTLCIDITGFPDAFFNPYAGQILLSVALASTPLAPIQLVYGSLEYECISLIVKECPNSTSDVVIPPDEEDTACCEPIPHTVAEMQALAGNFAPHAWYDITDAQSSFGVLRIRARDADNLEAKGTLIKGSRVFDVNYVLDDGSGNNIITYFRDDINNNTATNVPGTLSITPIIPVDGSWYDNDFVDLPHPTIADIATVQIVNSSLKLTTLNLNSSTLSSLNGITAFGGTINTAGVSSSIDSIWMINGGILSCTDATIHSATLDNESALTVDGNGALSASAINLCTIKNQSTLIVIGVNGGNGTAITRCNISGHITVTIKGGETYQDKDISQIQSDFNGARVIAASGAYNFVDSDLIPNYDRTFLGKVVLTATAPQSISSFINRAAGFGHPVIFELGAGSSPITFVDNGADIIMKGSANAVLSNEGDYVVLGFTGNVAKEIDRGIY